jgi:hypothetical protein
VRAAIVIENYTKQVDASGRPPSSFEAYVLDGSDEDVANTILNTKAAGIEPWGSISFIVADLSGNLHTMRFSRAEEIMVRLRVTVTTNSSFPAAGVAKIISSLIQYIGGEDTDGQLYTGLNMGSDVVYSRIVAATYKVDGLDDVTIEVSSDGTTWTSGNLAIAAHQVAQTSYQMIEVIGA